MKYGALPPPQFEWMMGKTAGSIEFVSDAQKFIDSKEGSDEDRERLEGMIEAIKNGLVVVTENISIEEYLKS